MCLMSVKSLIILDTVKSKKSYICFGFAQTFSLITAPIFLIILESGNVSLIHDNAFYGGLLLNN